MLGVQLLMPHSKMQELHCGMVVVGCIVHAVLDQCAHMGYLVEHTQVKAVRCSSVASGPASLGKRLMRPFSASEQLLKGEGCEVCCKLSEQ